MKRGVSLFIFCESLGWDLMQRLPFVDGLAENRAGVTPILGGGAATLPTVLSGAPPQEHEHFDWFVYSPRTSPFRMCRYLSYLPAAIKNSRRFRNAVVRWIRSANDITGRLDIFNMPLRRLPLFDFVEPRDLFERHALGKIKTLIDFFEENDIDYFCSDHNETDPENADALAEALYSRKIAAAFLHLRGIDTVVKHEGPGSSAVRGRMAWIDHRIRRLYETAAMGYDRVELVVFSDCGTLPVTNVFDLEDKLSKSRYAYGRDYVAVYGPTMAGFWFMTRERQTGLVQILNMLSCGRVLTKEELLEQGCWFSDNRFGEAIFLANPGTVFIPNDIVSAPLVTASGYHPHNEGLAAGFACNLGDIEPPKRLTQIHGLLVQSAARSAGIVLPAAASRRPAEAVETKTEPE